MSLRNQTPDGTELCFVFEHEGMDGGEPFLHVEVAIPEFFEEEEGIAPPKRSGSKKTFDKLIARFDGVEMVGTVTGSFVVSLAEVSSSGIIRLSEIEGIPGVKSRYRGASIELIGLPIRRIDWRRKDQDGVEIKIVGRLKFTLSERYLVEAVDFLKSGLSIAVTGEINELTT